MWFQTADELGFISPLQLVFPNTSDLPALGAEEAVDATVAGLVAGDLRKPESRPGLGPGRMLGATVPEAAVDRID